MEPCLESKRDTVKKLAEDGALSHLHCVEPVSCPEATNPTPFVVAHCAFHHRAASVLLQLAVALRALVEDDLSVDSFVQELGTVQALSFIMDFFWLVGLLAQVACFLLALWTVQLVLLLLVVMNSFIQYCIAVRLGAK